MPRNAGNSPKAERDKLRDRMRGYGCTVSQIAAEMSRRFNLRPGVAGRHALGWPQWKLAQRYNTLHPGAKLGDHRVSEYEAWPHGGAPPSLRYLAQLAVTFGHGCTPAQLVDADDLERLIPADRCLLTTGHPATAITTATPGSPTRSPARPGTQVTVLPASAPRAELVVPADPAVWVAAMGLQLPGDVAALLMTCLGLLTAGDSAALATPQERDQAYHRPVAFLTKWAHTMEKRREMLRTLGWAATAASVGYSPNPDEHARVAAVLGNTGRVDAHTIEHFETVLWRCKLQDDALGPQGVLDTVLAQRSLLRSLLPSCPEALRPRLLSTLAIASRYAGWCSFDLNDFDSAGYFYEDARALAHEAQNSKLSAMVLFNMGRLAVWQGKPRVGIDHAVAAMQWADRTDDMRLRAWTAVGAGRAYAADGQRDACLTALDAAETRLGRAGDPVPGYNSIYYDEGVHTSFCGECHLELRNAERAADYSQRSLATLDQSYTRQVALTTVDLARAYTQSGEIDEAARLLGDAGEIAAANSSTRLIITLRQGRADVQPWADTVAVRALDDRLASWGVAVQG